MRRLKVEVHLKNPNARYAEITKFTGKSRLHELQEYNSKFKMIIIRFKELKTISRKSDKGRKPGIQDKWMK